MTMVKRIVSAVACLILIICAGVFCLGSALPAGKGNGTDAQIATLSELKNLFDCIDGTGRGRSGSAFSLYSDDGDVEREYTSFTMVETTEMNTSNRSSRNYKNGGGRSTENFILLSRKLELYAAEDAMLYVSEGRLASTSSTLDSISNGSLTGNTGNGYISSVTKRSMDFKVKIYIRDDTVMLNAERFNFTYSYVHTDSENPDNNKTEREEDEDINVLRDNPNRWIDCSSAPHIANSFIRINDQNLQTLSSISRLIEESLLAEDDDETYFKKSGDVYTLKNDPLEKLFSASGDDVDFKGGFDINLSDKKVPFVEYSADIKVDQYTPSSEYAGSSDVHGSGYISDKILFKNINNTVVRDIDFDEVDFNDLVKDKD